MKDHDTMTKPSEMTVQDLTNELEAAVARAIRLAREAEKRSCEFADADPKQYGEMNAHLTEGLGRLYGAKASLTRGGLLMPDLTVAFGGK